MIYRNACVNLIVACILCSNQADAHINGGIELERSSATGSLQYAPPTDSTSAEAKYAPDRKIDIKHIALDVSPDFEKRDIRGTCTITFEPIEKALEEIRLDGVDLSVEAVSCTAPISEYHATTDEVVVDFGKPLQIGTDYKLTIRYSCHPLKGLYFRAPSNGYKADETHIFTQGEMIDGRHWFPSFDYPNEKFTSEVTCHVPQDMRVLSNGREISSTIDPNKLRSVHWAQDKPHANYLITLVAGYFNKIEDKCDAIPLNFYTLASDSKEAPIAFDDTKPMMEILQKQIDVPFPWAQYGQVVVRDFTQGGMENTSFTTLFDNLLRPATTENIQPTFNSDCYSLSSEGLIAHELAHQWFGDLVTCKDWSHSWLNEGFATYYSLLYADGRYGHDMFLYELYKDRRSVADEDFDPRPIVSHNYADAHEQFNIVRNYQKASWVLQMLREQLGETLFRRCIKTYLERYQFQNVVTADLVRVVEEVSGRSFDRFFDQWLLQEQVPKVRVTYSWDAKTLQAKITVDQSANSSNAQRARSESRKGREEESGKPKVHAFHFPLSICFTSKGERIDKRLNIEKAEETFYVHLDHQPETVSIDPKLALLAKIEFRPPTRMLYALLTDSKDVVARISACSALTTREDETSIKRLQERLQTDTFYGVRIEAANALATMHNEKSLEALVNSIKQDNPRVRNCVVMNIGKFFHPRAQQTLLDVIDQEKNPAILETAIKGLAPYHSKTVDDVLQKYLDSESYQQRLACAAISSIRAHEDPSFVPVLISVLKKRKDDFRSDDFVSSLDTLAYIDRNEKPRDDVRNFIAAYVNDKRQRIQVGAIRALGSLGDSEANPILQTFAAAAKDSPLRTEADMSLSQLRWNNRPSENLKEFRKEMLELKKTSSDQKSELDNIKKTLDAYQKGTNAGKNVAEKDDPKGQNSKGQHSKREETED
jgi:aminopeptidase N